MVTRIPEDPLGFIQRCVRSQKLYWTYHVNMRLASRFVTRDEILSAVGSYLIVEEYAEDKYLPSYLILGGGCHVLFAIDTEDDNVRIVTAYRPDPAEWEPGFVRRKRR
jgi:hypothetical protein